MVKYDFNKNWIFQKKGEGRETEVILPHDAMLQEGRNSKSLSGSAGAYFLGGIYIYKKQWVVPAECAGKIMILEFEGIYRNAEIKVNGQSAGRIVYGYTTRNFDITKYLCCGTENTIEVEVDNQEVPNSRWYSGSGIYRPVWLYVLEPIHIEPYGVTIQTLSYAPVNNH